MFDKRSMLIELTIRQWTARKYDKRVSDEVDKGHSAHGAGRFNKQLIAKNALAEIASAAAAVRMYHYSRTLPWGNNGQRLLPSEFFLEYRTRVQHLRDEFNRAVDMFIQTYPALVQDARQRLNTLFDPMEYPDVRDIRRAFEISYQVFPVPSAGDFRVEVAEDERREIAAQIEQATTERQQAATKACYVQVREVLERMKTQCVKGKTRVTTSLADDIRELALTLDGLNINNDAELARIAQSIRDDLVVDVDDLRNNSNLRASIGDRASELLASIPWN